MQSKYTFSAYLSLFNSKPLSFTNEQEPEDFFFWVAYISGWIYLISWSLSFYGQLYENFKNKSVKGLSWDYALFNISGFLAYSVYSVWGFIDPKIGATIEIQDLIFPTHASIITGLTFFQLFYYKDRSDEKQKFSKFCLYSNALIWFGFILLIFLERAAGMYNPDIEGDNFKFNSVIFIGEAKAYITAAKYMPQVIMNYKNKSTKGFSMLNVFLDFTGCFFSILQNVIDTIKGLQGVRENDINIVKYLISVISFIFDVIFIVQHYYLYKDSSNDAFSESLNNDLESNLNYDENKERKISQNTEILDNTSTKYSNTPYANRLELDIENELPLEIESAEIN